MGPYKLSLICGLVLALAAPSVVGQVVVDMPGPPPTPKVTAEATTEDGAATSTSPRASNTARIGDVSIAGYLGRSRPAMNPRSFRGYGSGYGYSYGRGYPYGYWGRGYPYGYWGLGYYGFGFHGHHGHGTHIGHGHLHGTRIGGFRTIGHFSHQGSHFGIHINF